MKLKDFYIIRDTQWYEISNNGQQYIKRRILLFGIVIYRFSKQIKTYK